MKNQKRGRVYQQINVNRRTGERSISPIFSIEYHRRGKKFRESSHSTDYDVANSLLVTRLKENGQGLEPRPNIEKTTFEHLAEMIRNDYKAKRRRSADRLENSLMHLASFFGECLAINITSDRAVAYVAHRQDEDAADASINRELSALRRMFTLAHKVGKVAQRLSVEMLPESNTRKGFFEPEQFQAVLDRLPGYLQPAIQTAYITGWRLRSEILTRQKHHVDLDAGWLRLDPGETKNGEGRNFPLTPELRAVIEAQLEKTREFVIATGKIVPWLFHKNGDPIGSFRKTWIAACKAACVPGRLVHDFRRTAVRNLERAAVPRSSAKAMVGHKTEAIYSRYAIVDSTMLKKAAEKLAAFHAGEKRTAVLPSQVVPFKKVGPVG